MNKLCLLAGERARAPVCASFSGAGHESATDRSSAARFSLSRGAVEHRGESVIYELIKLVREPFLRNLAARGCALDASRAHTNTHGHGGLSSDGFGWFGARDEMFMFRTLHMGFWLYFVLFSELIVVRERGENRKKAFEGAARSHTHGTD